ncbi:RNA polymerase sigma factor [Flavitalea flava]
MVYENYLGFAFKIVFRYIYRYERTMDVVSDGFVKLFTSFERFEATDTEEDTRNLLMGYIKRIMVNASIDELRKGNMLPEIGGLSDHVWDYTSRDDDADQQLLYKQLIVLIKELPPSYRTVFNMYVIDGFNHLEIADLLKIPVGSSKSNLSRAKKMLQERIKKSEEAKLCSI